MLIFRLLNRFACTGAYRFCRFRNPFCWARVHVVELKLSGSFAAAMASRQHQSTLACAFGLHEPSCAAAAHLHVSRGSGLAFHNGVFFDARGGNNFFASATYRFATNWLRLIFIFTDQVYRNRRRFHWLEVIVIVVALHCHSVNACCNLHSVL